MINNNEDLPVNYKILSGEIWKDFTGSLAGSSQPGYYWIPTISDQQVLVNLENGMNLEEAGVDPWMIEEFNALNQEGVDVIYSVACAPCERDPNLLQWIWKNKFNKTLITEIDNISINIPDFHAPSIEQLEAISNDVIIRLKKGENCLITCGAGIGRTGTIIASIFMKATGLYEAKQSLFYIRNNYSHNAVEGKIQYEALEAFAEFNRKNAISDDSIQEHELENFDINKINLIDAVKIGDPALIKILLDNKTDANQIIDDTSALLEAAKIGKPSIVKSLIAHGANVDIYDSQGQTALIKAVMNPSKVSLKVMYLLLENKADISKCDNNGNNALFYINNSNNKINKYKQELLLKAKDNLV